MVRSGRSTAWCLYPPFFYHSSLDDFTSDLSAIAETDRVILYSLTFENIASGFQKRLEFINSALLHLRAGCTHLEIIAGSEGIAALIKAGSHFRPNQDTVRVIRRW